MKIEEEIKSTVELSLAKKVILNLSFSRSIIGDKFLEILKPFDLSSEQYNVLRILRGQKGKPANMSVIQERMISKNSNTTRLVDKLVLKELDNIRHDGYYVKMAVAWAISISYIKFEELTLDYLKNNNLDDYTYNKSLQKICESLKVDKATKDVIKGMKRKRISSSALKV